MRICRLFFLTGIIVIFLTRLSFAVPITANTNSRIILVEYYDYECPHCRRMESVIDQLQRSYPELQVIHRVTPLLTTESYPVTSFTLAVREQGGWQVWEALHQRLMQLSRAPTFRDAQEITTDLGLNTPVILKEMQQSDIQQEMMKNINLAESHAIAGHVYLPILVFGLSDSRGPQIVLTGEQPYELLSAIVQQLLDDQHVQLVQTLGKMQSSR